MTNKPKPLVVAPFVDLRGCPEHIEWLPASLGVAKEEPKQGGDRGPSLLPVFFPQGLHSEDSVLIMVRVQAGIPEHAGKMPSSRLSRFCDGHLLPKKKNEKKKIQITKVF